jgi:IS30 family transposase
MSSGLSQRQIARKIGVNASTISLELSRNRKFEWYDHATANEKAKKRRSLASRIPKKIKGSLENQVLDGLFSGWSPDQISGRLRLEGIKISSAAIYNYVHKEKLEFQCLRHKGKKYKRPKGSEAGVGCIPGRVGIEERPAEVDEKTTIGHWEGDTIISCNSRCALLTLVERMSKFLLAKKIGRKTMENTAKANVELLNKHKKYAKSTTYDNGMEFAGHAKIAKALKCDIYFARPYKSCDRGLNEHTNGLIRQYLPKKFDFKDVSDENIQIIVDLINNRPRKVLNYKTPAEVFFRPDFTTGVALHC